MRCKSILTMLFALGVAALLSRVPDVLAQSLDGTLRGQVRDSTGALVPGAVVTAKNNGTGAVRTVETSSAGTYAFTNLLVGNYSVSAELKGFKKHVRPSVDLRANQVVEVDMTLELGEVTTVVEVEEGADLVQTTSSQLASSISGRALTDLPDFGNAGDGSPYALLPRAVGSSVREAPLAETGPGTTISRLMGWTTTASISRELPCQ
jgi:hypothetical protein